MADKNGFGLQMWEGHEDRIRNLERDRIEMAKEMSEITATLRTIKEDISDLATYNREANRTISDLLQNLQTHIAIDEQRFKHLETKSGNKLAEIWAAWWGKILFAVLTGGGGVLLALINEWVNR